MRYKVGGKVRIKSLDWVKHNYKTDEGDFRIKVNENLHPLFNKGMLKYCDKVATIIRVVRKNSDVCFYLLDIDNQYWFWYKEMFEENFKNMETKKIMLPDGWEIDKIENGEIILKESKRELPKTFERCLEALGYDINNTGYVIKSNKIFEGIKNSFISDGLVKPMLALMQLLVCREVYRQGWEPDWNKSEVKYCILSKANQIVKVDYESIKRTLSFQSEEVRDKFLENFRDLIEEAKELI